MAKPTDRKEAPSTTPIEWEDDWNVDSDGAVWHTDSSGAVWYVASEDLPPKKDRMPKDA